MSQWRFYPICLALEIGGLVLFAGCAVGPDYKRPDINSPAAFRTDNATTNSLFTELTWWQVYQDDTLQALIREAFTNNYDLRIRSEERRVGKERRATWSAYHW